MDSQKIFTQIEAMQQEMIDSLTRLIRIPAVGPESGGEGEAAKAEALIDILKTVGFDRIERFDASDQKVPSGKRPNIVTYLNGDDDSRRLWIVTHMDVVPAGEESLWKVTKPFEPLLKDGCVFGRGSEDNGQSLVSSLYAAKALKTLGVKPKHTLGLAFVSDEEQGSTKGIQYLIACGLFRKDDLIVVPDHGTADGHFIEIAEKSILWLKFTTVGKQAHGSLPDKGLNAHRIGMQFALAVDTMLHKRYDAKDSYFDPEESTFEPTRKEKNVDAINIVPGEDVLYFDCRILPKYEVDQVLTDIQTIKTEFEAKTGAKITVENIQKQPAPKLVDANAEIVNMLRKALKMARGIEGKVGGVGGGTCAAFFRQAEIPAVVWSTIDEVPHSPDEYSRVSNMVADAKVFALLAIL
ncbi:MAG TPA: M20 family metallo-hydrolase [Candidatus Nanoarchaeia archaeon]|nr:M20 family metallo-hydrolase [Candidatus Nanoarchaeia archaeon]